MKHSIDNMLYLDKQLGVVTSSSAPPRGEAIFLSMYSKHKKMTFFSLPYICRRLGALVYMADV